MLRKILLAACIVLVFLVVTETVLTFCVLFSADGLSASFLYEKTLVFPFSLLVKDRVKSVGNKVSFGHDENGDALQWVICTVQKDGCLLPAAKPVGTRPNDNAGETKWSKTSLQKRLNGDFFDTSFTDEEKACMVRETVTVKTRDWT